MINVHYSYYLRPQKPYCFSGTAEFLQPLRPDISVMVPSYLPSFLPSALTGSGWPKQTCSQIYNFVAVMPPLVSNPGFVSSPFQVASSTSPINFSFFTEERELSESTPSVTAVASPAGSLKRSRKMWSRMPAPMESPHTLTAVRNRSLGGSDKWNLGLHSLVNNNSNIDNNR